MGRKIQIEVPTSLEDITLGQYQHYLKILDQNEGEEANDFINKKLVEIFCNINLNEVDSIPLVDFNRILEVLDKAFKEKFPLIKHFELGGVEFGFIPKLDDMSLGEYVDVEATISDWQNIHKAMSVLFRPVNFKSKDKYTIAPYKPNDDIKEWMKQMPLSVVMGCMVFFYDLGSELSRASLAYLEREMKKDKTSQLKEALEESGVGISQFMDSLKETSQSLTKSPNQDLLGVSPISPSRSKKTKLNIDNSKDN